MVSKSEVRDLLSEVMDGQVKNLEEAPVGRAHSTYFFSTKRGRYVVKLSEEDVRFQVEGPALSLLNKSADVAIPGVVDFDNTRTEYDFMYVVSEFVPGENVDNWENPEGPKFNYLSSYRKKSLLSSAGRELAKLHKQTEFDDFGHFKSENNKLEFRQGGSWEETFRKIILEEQVSNFPERFEDLKPVVKEFLEENIDVIRDASNPCLIHQDFRWPNMLVDDEVNAVIDWERALAGHHEYDLFKAEESLINFKTKKASEKYRARFLNSYREIMELSDGWKERRQFYRALRSVESLWTFEGWTKGFNNEKKGAMANWHRERLLDRISSF